jgi:hypothetical protein
VSVVAGFKFILVTAFTVPVFRMPLLKVMVFVAVVLVIVFDVLSLRLSVPVNPVIGTTRFKLEFVPIMLTVDD